MVKLLDNRVVFITGVYGVGKSTICERVGRRLNIPVYSAGDLISARNGELYGANKYVKNVDLNQEILISAINEKLYLDKTILLAGHLCIFGEGDRVEAIPMSALERMSVSCIILLETDTTRILQHLSQRDHKRYSKDKIETLQLTELDQAIVASEYLGVPFVRIQMNYDDSDDNKITQAISKLLYGDVHESST